MVDLGRTAESPPIDIRADGGNPHPAFKAVELRGVSSMEAFDDGELFLELRDCGIKIFGGFFCFAGLCLGDFCGFGLSE